MHKSGAVRRAEFAMAEDRLEDAVHWARRAAEWESRSGYLHHLLGRILNLAGRQREAQSAFTKAMDLEPQSAEHPYALGLIAAEQQRIGEAIQWLKKTVELDPGFDRAWYNLGLARSQQSQAGAALEALQTAEELNPAPFGTGLRGLRRFTLSGGPQGPCVRVDPLCGRSRVRDFDTGSAKSRSGFETGG